MAGMMIAIGGLYFSKRIEELNIRIVEAPTPVEDQAHDSFDRIA